MSQGSTATIAGRLATGRRLVGRRPGRRPCFWQWRPPAAPSRRRPWHHWRSAPLFGRFENDEQGILRILVGLLGRLKARPQASLFWHMAADRHLRYGSSYNTVLGDRRKAGEQDPHASLQPCLSSHGHMFLAQFGQNLGVDTAP